MARTKKPSNPENHGVKKSSEKRPKGSKKPKKSSHKEGEDTKHVEESGSGSGSGSGSKKASSKKSKSKGVSALRKAGERKKHTTSRRARAKSRITKSQKRVDLIIANKRTDRLIDMVLGENYVTLSKTSDGKGGKGISGDKTHYNVSKKARLLFAAAHQAVVYGITKFAPDAMALTKHKNPDATKEDIGTENEYQYPRKFKLVHLVHTMSIYQNRPRAPGDDDFDAYIAKFVNDNS